MKANAPDKLYYAPYGDMRENHPITDNDIEYIRKDAFIEKVCDYLNKTCRRFILTEKDIDDFRKYMEGE